MPRKRRLGGLALTLAAVAASAQSGQEAVLLEPGKALERDISGGQTHSYRITAAPDEFVAITIQQRGVDVSERLFAPDGKLAAEFNDEMRPEEKERVEFVAGTAGIYRLDIRPNLKSAAGRYGIGLAEIRAATGHDRLLHEARVLSTRSSRLGSAGEYDAALPLAARAIEIGEKELGPRHAYTGDLLALSGNLFFQKGDYEQAEELFRRSLAVREIAVGVKHPGFAESMQLLGVVYKARGDYSKAEPLLQRALDLTVQALGPEHPEVVRCLLEISSLYVRRGDFARAGQELRRALTIAGKSLEADDFLLAKTLNNLGVLYNSQKDYDRAEPLLQRALEIEERTLGPDSPQLALPLQNLGMIAQEKRKDHAKALDLYWRAVTVLGQRGDSEDPRLAGILNNIANIYKSRGEYSKALELHFRVHAIYEKKLGPYNGLTLTSLGNIARTYAALGDIENAIEFQARADQVMEKNLALNLAIGSERQKLAYFESLSERTSRTISLHVSLAPTAPSAPGMAALVVFQRKGRILDAMSGSFAALRQRVSPADGKLFEDLNTSSGELAKLALNGPGKLLPKEYRERLAALEEHKERVEAEISRRSAEFRVQSQAVTLAAVQGAIPREAALIEFAAYRPFDPKADNAEAYGELRYIAYILRREGEVMWKELGPAADIDRAVESFRRALRDPRRKDVERLARAVDGKVMEPLRRLAGDATQLLISPDGALNLIPMEALLDEQGRYMVERYSISYLTSGRDLLRIQAPRTGQHGPVVIADPYFGEPDMALTATGSDLSSVYFAPLGGTAQEARTIKSRFPEARVLTGRQATESALKQLEAPSILHIATHGFFLQDAAGSAPPANSRLSGTRAINATTRIENPLLRSGLALAGANLRQTGAEDGILTALEASGLNLWGTKLVTLSACDTGVGEVKNGEGVYGLRRAFFLAGAETLVMSLWPVSDYVTGQTMTAYYSGLKQGLGRGEALRQAQLAMLRRDGRRHPFYWASFIQSGEWANLDGQR